eukprot:365315-Chlamydomonas_euryale.AAC.15
MEGGYSRASDRGTDAHNVGEQGSVEHPRETRRTEEPLCPFSTARWTRLVAARAAAARPEPSAHTVHTFVSAASADRQPTSSTHVATMLTTMNGVGGTAPLDSPRSTRPSGVPSAHTFTATPAAAGTRAPCATLP